MTRRGAECDVVRYDAATGWRKSGESSPWAGCRSQPCRHDSYEAAVAARDAVERERDRLAVAWGRAEVRTLDLERERRDAEDARDAAMLDLARLRYAVERPSEACSAVPTEVWGDWLREHGFDAWAREPGTTAEGFATAARISHIREATLLADLLTRTDWRPAEGT